MPKRDVRRPHRANPAASSAFHVSDNGNRSFSNRFARNLATTPELLPNKWALAAFSFDNEANLMEKLPTSGSKNPRSIRSSDVGKPNSGKSRPPNRRRSRISDRSVPPAARNRITFPNASQRNYQLTRLPLHQSSYNSRCFRQNRSLGAQGPSYQPVLVSP